MRGDARRQVTIPFIVMQGVIQAGGTSGGPFQPQSNRINLQRFNGIFDKAFKTKNAPAVALVINSPGGSPVQSSLIYKRLLHLKKKYKKPIHVFVEDVCASGGTILLARQTTLLSMKAALLDPLGS